MPGPLASQRDVTVELANDDRTPLLRRVLLNPSATLSVLILVFVIFGMTRSSTFLQGLTWVNIIRDASFTAILASFEAIVLIGGGLDLSIGSVYAAAAMFSAHLMVTGWTPSLAIIMGVLLGAGVGLVNGLLTNFAKIPPIIATLATMYAVRSVVNAVSKGSTVPVPINVSKLVQTNIFGIPPVVFAAIAVCVVAHVLLSMTNMGWSIRATGGNLGAARNAGLNVHAISIMTYVMCGAAAAFTGILQAGRLGSAPSNLGTGMELIGIAAAVIGGTSVLGAVGSVPGAVLGALMMSILNFGLIILHIDPNWQNFVIGAVLVLAGSLDQLSARQQFKMSAKRTAAANEDVAPAPAERDAATST